ncbi:MAG TPA: hypothetical protein VF040_08615 [Ktedonobacterales bacterium]
MENKLKLPTSSPRPMPASATPPVLEDDDATRDALRLLLELEGEEVRLDEATRAYDALVHLRTARHSHIVLPD